MIARVLLVCFVLLAGSLMLAESAGGCLYNNIPIPTVTPRRPLLNRLYQICKGRDRYRKTYFNEEECLPLNHDYLEFNMNETLVE